MTGAISPATDGANRSRHLVASVVESLGDVWALANVAAVHRRRSLDEVDDEAWNLQMDVNVRHPSY